MPADPQVAPFRPEWPCVTASIESAMYSSASAHPVTLGVTDDGERHHGGDGRTVGYLSGASRQPDSAVWRERHQGKVPMTRLWLRLDPEQLAQLPGVREAALEASPVVPVPPCSTCEGSGRVYVLGEASDTCPSCNGTGRDRLIPESEIRAWIAEWQREHGPRRLLALLALGHWLDERSER